MDPHAPFIIAAFAASGLTLLGLVLWVVADHRRLRRALERAGR